MSATPRQAKPPSDDFVLWPEPPGQGVGRANETIIRRCLDGLAPAELAADSEAVDPAPAAEEPRQAPQGEERFYPASRNWFRTTASIPSADASEKWWQESPAVPKVEVPPAAPAPPPPSVRQEVPAEPAPHTALLSPEEIWELAAEELEQASRLAAPAAPSQPPAPDAPVLPTAVQPSIPPSAFFLEPTAFEPPAPPAPAAAAASVPTASPDPPTPGDWMPSVSASTPSVPEGRVEHGGDCAAGVESAAGSESEESAADERFPACAQPTDEDSIVLLEIPFPRKPSPPSVTAFEEDGARDEATPEVATQEVAMSKEATSEDKTEPQLPASPVEPVQAMPGESRPPIFMRGEPSETSLPTQRLSRRADQSVFALAEEDGKGEGEWPFAQAADSGDTESPAVAEPEPPGVGRRRRQHRKDDRRMSDVSRPGRRRWGRRIAGLVGLLLVSVGVAVVMGRDYLPEDWRAAPAQWWRKAHQLVFPHQYGQPRRGVQPWAGESSDPGRPTRTEAVPPASPIRSATLQLGNGAPVVDGTAPPPDLGTDAEFREGDATLDTDISTAAERDTDFSVALPRAVSTSEPPSPPGSFTLWDGDDPAAGTVATGQVDAVGAPRHEPESANAEVLEAQKAVRSLVAARTVAEVLPWIFDARKLEPTVRAYHSQYPLQPPADTVIEHEYSAAIPATGGRVHIFNVLGSSHPRGFPVSAEFTSQGYRIDWQSYIQWRDAWLQRFLDTKPAEAHTLYVVLHRTHYFNDDVPNLDDKLAFKLTSAVPGDEGAVAFVEKNSAVGRSLAELYEWRTMYFPVVELQWVPAGKAGRYLRLNRIVRPTWRPIGQ